MRCETFIELTIVILLARIIAETASEPRWLPSRRRRHCRAQNCFHGHWSGWSSCSQSCGAAGQLTQTRAILRPASCGGTACSTSKTKPCNRFCLNGGTLTQSSCYCKAGYQGPCCEQVIGGWTSWGSWYHCSATCGKGMQRGTRSCTKPGGVGCVGNNFGYRPCFLRPCITAYVAWSHWITCSKTCGTGSQSRKRTCYGSIAGQGQCSGSVETRNCNTQNCPVVNGGWGEWSPWSSCSESCGPGTAIRIRRCDSPPPGPGGKCIGLFFESQLCDEGPCPGSNTTIP